MRSHIAFGLFAALSLFAGAANAELLRHKYFGAMVNGFDPDPSRGINVTEGFGGALWLGYELHRNVYIEGQLFSNVFETGEGGGTDLYQSGVSLDLMGTLFRRDTFTPFVVAGVGFAYDDVVPNERDSGNFFGNVGGGILSRAIGEGGLRLRVEFRATYDDFQYANDENGVWDYRAGLGIEIPVAPAEMVVREIPVGVDTRQRPDGYPPRPVAAGIDSDDDGVLDNFDRCPGTLPGSIVDRSGCVGDEQAVAVLYGVHFEWAEHRLLPDARNILDQTVKMLKGQPNLHIEIVGHADTTGGGASNKTISQKRAQSVMDYLVKRGIDESRLIARGAGDVEPVAPNTTEMGRWQNRRVEFRLHVE